MTPAEFASRMVGVPWKKGHASWDAADCYGCVILYFREVLGIELTPIQWSEDTTAEAFAAQSHKWQECEPESGAICFMCWRDGAPEHCGLLLPDGRVLHSEGSETTPGSVRVSRLSVMTRFYGDVKFYRYRAC